MNHEPFIVLPDKKISLKDYDSKYTGRYHDKEEATEKLQADIADLVRLQDILYAHDVYGILMIFQALDAAGKDGTIKHVMSGVNPQGCQVYSFKAPSSEELDHDYLWRCMKALPERGRIGIFNRSYYEEVLVVKVHNDMLKKQKLPPLKSKDDLWEQRYDEINQFEKYLVKNGIIVLKFYLNVSKDEQKKRFLKRINQPEKNWKFSLADAKERAHWKEYQKAYEDLFNYTSTKYAPWYIIPADNKWFTRTVVADIIVNKLKSLDLKYPDVPEEHKQELLKIKEILENEE
jgi:PPK2 family polyphosphate:nucleotide phosphotransferase